MSQIVTDRRIDYSKPVFGNDVTQEEVEYKPVNIAQIIKDFPIVPYPGRVYVVQAEVEKSKGLYIPVSAQKEGEMQTNFGWVIACGDNVDFCKLGDKVFYGRYSGSWVLDMQYRVMNEEDLLGRYKSND
jgi:co-chaperonin GroES (HSP10)